MYDVRGAQVSVFEERVFAGGEHVVEWKAVDTYGRILPAGVYIATLEFDGNRVATRFPSNSSVAMYTPAGSVRP